VLEQLQHVTVGIAEEDLHVTVAARHRAAGELDGVVGEPGAGAVEIVHFEREMVRHATLDTGAGIALAGSSRRMLVGEQMQLGAAEAKPRPVEHEVRRPRHLLEPQRARVEAA